MSKPISHTVFFTLEDSSSAAIEHLVAQCKEYLDNHPGLSYFAVGTVNPDLSRPVNDKGYDVSLHTVFEDRAAHDVYQTAERHVTFIENNKANWKQVRVFDSDLH
jgi:hypothetical protein